MKKAKILITGSTGNVGKALVKHFISKYNKYNILCLARKKRTEKHYIHGNLNDYNSLLKATKKVDIVIHLAAATKGSIKELENVNVKGTANLIRACEKNNVKKIVFISSLDAMFDTPYGVSKKKAEDIVKSSKLDYIILRPSLIYGKHLENGLAPLITIIKKSYFIPIIGSGKNKYQPIYIYDLVAVIEKIIKSSRFPKNTYFVAGPDVVSFEKLIDLISQILRKKAVKIHIPVPLFFLDLADKILKKIGAGINFKNYRLDKICDTSKIKKDFGFKGTSLKEGLEKTIL